MNLKDEQTCLAKVEDERNEKVISHCFIRGKYEGNLDLEGNLRVWVEIV